MADVIIYHPETEGTVAVPEEALYHYRQSGWITAAERNELQARAEAAARPPSPAAPAAHVRPPGKSTKE